MPSFMSIGALDRNKYRVGIIRGLCLNKKSNSDTHNNVIETTSLYVKTLNVNVFTSMENVLPLSEE